MRSRKKWASFLYFHLPPRYQAELRDFLGNHEQKQLVQAAPRENEEFGLPPENVTRPLRELSKKKSRQPALPWAWQPFRSPSG